MPADAHVDGALVLVGKALFEEVFSGAQDRRGVLVDAHEGGQLGGDLRQGGDLVEILLRVGILFADPGARGGTFCVFEPAVGVFDLRAVVVVGDDVDGGDGRRGQGDAVVAFDGLRRVTGILGSDHQGTSEEDEGGNGKGNGEAASGGHAVFLIGKLAFGQTGQFNCFGRGCSRKGRVRAGRVERVVCASARVSVGASVVCEGFCAENRRFPKRSTLPATAVFFDAPPVQVLRRRACPSCCRMCAYFKGTCRMHAEASLSLCYGPAALLQKGVRIETSMLPVLQPELAAV